MNLITLLAALSCSLSIFGVMIHQISYHAQQQTTNSQIELEAQELLTFAQAALYYTQGIGDNLSPKTLTVTNFRADKLLPTSFPDKTPFGQSWQADFVTDPQNRNVLDLLIRASGPFLNQSSTSTGETFSDREIATRVIQKLEQLQENNSKDQLVAGVASGGITLGTVYQENFTTLAGTATPDLEKMGLDAGSTYTPAIFVAAPNQFGYWVFALADYGASAVWGLTGDAANQTPGIRNTFVPPSIHDEGWKETCPSIGVNLGSVNEADNLSGNNTLYDDSGNISQSTVFCIPAYKGEVKSVQSAIDADSGEQAFGQSTWHIWELITPAAHSIPNYDPTGQYLTGYGGSMYALSPPVVNPNLYGKGLFYSMGNLLPVAPDVDFIPSLPLPSLLAAQGFRVQVDDNVYQFANLTSAVFTGEGEIDPTGKEIWATGGSPSQQNLNTSQESFSILWQVRKNPTNPDNVTFSIPYETASPNPLQCTTSAAGNRYHCHYQATIPTPRIN